MSRSIITAALPLLLPLALLPGCSRGSDDPGAIGADEAAQLNDAAAMLDANSIALDAVTNAPADAASANRTDAR
ncbi:MAG: hypothetical protein PGN08_05625 [Sphingomonas taxi]